MNHHRHRRRSSRRRVVYNGNSTSLLLSTVHLFDLRIHMLWLASGKVFGKPLGLISSCGLSESVSSGHTVRLEPVYSTTRLLVLGMSRVRPYLSAVLLSLFGTLSLPRLGCDSHPNVRLAWIGLPYLSCTSAAIYWILCISQRGTEHGCTLLHGDATTLVL